MAELSKDLLVALKAEEAGEHGQLIRRKRGKDLETLRSSSSPTPAATAHAWASELVSLDAAGKLVYASDPEGNRIPDFSYAGYHNSERRIPDVPTAETIRPISGDNTSHIQSALDAVGQRPLGSDGLRGAVLLQAGEYEVAGTIRLNHSGVVLRGVGDGVDPANHTVLRAVGNQPADRQVIVAGSELSTRWAGEISGTRTNITSPFVPVGSQSFSVGSADALSVGDNVIIVHPCTREWLDAIDGGGTATDPPWRVDEQPIIYNRYVTAIDGNRVTIDAPVFNHLDRSLSQCFLYRWDRAGLITEVAFGFQLRPDSREAARKSMFDTLRTAFNRDSRVRIDYSQTGPTTGVIIRACNC